jgi:hypothetical protein
VNAFLSNGRTKFETRYQNVPISKSWLGGSTKLKQHLKNEEWQMWFKKVMEADTHEKD